MKKTHRKTRPESRSHERQSKPARKGHAQPQPFTPGITKGMVRQHAFELYRDKLPDEPLTLEDWVLAEKDLVQDIQTEGLPQR